MSSPGIALAEQTFRGLWESWHSTKLSRFPGSLCLRLSERPTMVEPTIYPPDGGRSHDELLAEWENWRFFLRAKSAGQDPIQLANILKDANLSAYSESFRSIVEKWYRCCERLCNSSGIPAKDFQLEIRQVHSEYSNSLLAVVNALGVNSSAKDPNHRRCLPAGTPLKQRTINDSKDVILSYLRMARHELVGAGNRWTFNRPAEAGTDEPLFLSKEDTEAAQAKGLFLYLHGDERVNAKTVVITDQDGIDRSVPRWLGHLYEAYLEALLVGLSTIYEPINSIIAQFYSLPTNAEGMRDDILEFAKASNVSISNVIPLVDLARSNSQTSGDYVQPFSHDKSRSEYQQVLPTRTVTIGPNSNQEWFINAIFNHWNHEHKWPTTGQMRIFCHKAEKEYATIRASLDFTFVMSENQHTENEVLKLGLRGWDLVQGDRQVSDYYLRLVRQSAEGFIATYPKSYSFTSKEALNTVNSLSEDLQRIVIDLFASSVISGGLTSRDEQNWVLTPDLSIIRLRNIHSTEAFYETKQGHPQKTECIQQKHVEFLQTIYQERLASKQWPDTGKFMIDYLPRGDALSLLLELDDRYVDYQVDWYKALNTPIRLSIEGLTIVGNDLIEFANMVKIYQYIVREFEQNDGKRITRTAPQISQGSTIAVAEVNDILEVLSISCYLGLQSQQIHGVWQASADHDILDFSQVSSITDLLDAIAARSAAALRQQRLRIEARPSLQGETEVTTPPKESATMKADKDSQVRILLCTATDIEDDAIDNHLKVKGIEKQLVSKPGGTFFEFSFPQSKRVFHSRSGQGGQGSLGAELSTSDAIRELSPHYVISCGIAFGSSSTKQVIGEVLVSEWVRCYDKGKEGSDSFRPRGERANADPYLIQAAQAVRRLRSDLKVSVGGFLSGDKLVDNQEFKTALWKIEPEAIGGDMEGAGIMAACGRARVRWIVVKAICDWGVDKDSSHQKTAAESAISFVFSVLESGALIPR